MSIKRVCVEIIKNVCGGTLTYLTSRKKSGTLLAVSKLRNFSIIHTLLKVRLLSFMLNRHVNDINGLRRFIYYLGIIMLYYLTISAISTGYASLYQDLDRSLAAGSICLFNYVTVKVT